MIQFENISKSFPSGSLFKDVNLTIKRGIRVGLVGKNGSGKTTLLKMMLGKESPDSGNIKKEKDLTIGYLQQEIVIGTERSIIEEVMASYPGAYDLEKKIISLSKEISNSPTNIVTGAKSALLARLTSHAHFFASAPVYDIVKGVGAPLIGRQVRVAAAPNVL